MGTPCYIAKQLGDDSFLAIYCGIEGHLGSTGYLLSKHYNTPEQVDALLSRGDIYSVDATIDKSHPRHRVHSDPAAEMCIEDMLEGDVEVDYLYFFTQDNRWKFVCCTTEEMELRDVAEVLQANESQVSDPGDPYSWLKDGLRKFLADGGEDEAPAMQM